MSKEQVKEHEDEFFLADDEDEDTSENKYLTFKISDEDYGIPINDVTEIIEIQKITDVPDMPEYVMGVINLRGRVIPVIDLRLRFRLPKRDYDDRTCIVIVNINNTAIGFIVDRVLEVVDITADNIDPAPDFKTASGKDKYISGIGKVGNDVKILLDAKKIIQQEDIIKIEENVK